MATAVFAAAARSARRVGDTDEEATDVSVLPGPEPFQHDGGPVGVLLCHGLTGNPVSLRPWAEHLADAGFSVSVPLLPGHGTHWQDANRTRWSQWYAAVDVALSQLHQTCDVVVVGGLSMGGALALRLAQLRPDEVAGLVLVNPAVMLDDPRLRALPLIRLLLPSLPAIGNDIKKPGVSEDAYDRTPLRALHSAIDLMNHVRADLASVTQPILLFRSPQDHVVPAASSATIVTSVSSADVTEVICADSYHVATLDHDAPLISRRTVDFVHDIAAAHAAPSRS